MNDPPRIAVEICVDDVEGALLAEQEGADRIELCAALSEGGSTPSIGLVRTVLERVRRIGVQILVRPRGGDFTASPVEVDVMLADIAAVRSLYCGGDGRVGFVFGVLTEASEIDLDATARLKAACGTAPTTFHKAFDTIADQGYVLDRLAALGIDRVLTSGGAATAEAGRAALASLVRHAGDRIIILAGGGVRAGNAAATVALTGVREIHARAMLARPDGRSLTARREIAALLRSVGAPS